MDFLNQQLGRIILGVAVVLTVAATVLQSAPPQTAAPEEAPGPLQVKIDLAALAAAGAEKYFAPGNGKDYMGGERFVFVPEKKIRIYERVDLELPTASVMAAPTILPDPGPTLQGSHDLPRMDKFLTTLPPDLKPPEKNPVRTP